MRNLRHLICLFTLAASITVTGQHHDQPGKNASGKVDLGELSFPNSGPANAQKPFIEGVLLLHSFEYGRARAAFQEASRIAPNFALAYWGEAMTYDHPIWPENDKAGGLAALAKLAPTPSARRAKAPTTREKMYLDAVEQLFGEGDTSARAGAYSTAMEALTKQFPDDLEASAFYALSIMGLTRTTRHAENYIRAAKVAEAVYERNPRHPGALHYLIHAYDDPLNAPRGLRAARAYGTVARSASHAQHMPSHIFFALGMWEDSIATNIASMKTARDAGSGGYHPLFWLIHAYLQLGKKDEAAKLVAVIEDDMKVSPSPYARTHLAMARATMIVETRGDGLPSLFEPVDAAGIMNQSVFAGHDLAVGLEYVRRKDLAAARGLLSSIRSRSAKMKGARSHDNGSLNRYVVVTQTDIDIVTVMDMILEAAIDFATGADGSMQKAIFAAETEDKLVFEYGPPAIVKPAWEAAGEMLLEAGRRKEAANAFRNVLKRYPNRRLANEGLRLAQRDSQ